MKIEGINANYTMICSNYFGIRDKTEGNFTLSDDKRKENAKQIIKFIDHYKKWFFIADDRLKTAVVDGRVKRSSYELFISRQIRISSSIKVILDNVFNGDVYFNCVEFEKQHMHEYASKKVFDIFEEMYYQVCKRCDIKYEPFKNEHELEKEFVSKLKIYNKYLKINTDSQNELQDFLGDNDDGYIEFKKSFKSLENINEYAELFKDLITLIYIKCRHNYARFNFVQFVKDYSNKYLQKETILFVKEMYEKIISVEQKHRVLEKIYMPSTPNKIQVSGIEGDYILLIDNYFAVRDDKCGKPIISQQKRDDILDKIKNFLGNYKKWFKIADERLKDAVVEGKVKRSSYDEFCYRQTEISSYFQIIFDKVLSGDIYFDFQEYEKKHIKEYASKEVYNEIDKMARFIIKLELTKFDKE